MEPVEKLLLELSQQPAQSAAFPSHFGIVIELRNSINDDRVTVKNVAALIRREPIIASKVVASANSAASAPSSQILDVESAVGRIGFESVKRIVIAVTMLQLSRSKDLIPFHSLSRKAWLNSIYCAAAGSVIAKNHTEIDPDEAFFACLTLNIGAFYILHQASKVKSLKEAPGAVAIAIQRDYLSRTREVLNFLSVPEKITEAVDIKNHYPNPKSKALSLKDIVVIANDMAALNYPWLHDADERLILDDFTPFVGDLEDIDMAFSTTRASFNDE